MAENATTGKAKIPPLNKTLPHKVNVGGGKPMTYIQNGYCYYADGRVMGKLETVIPPENKGDGAGDEKIRVSALADELGVTSKELLEKLEGMGYKDLKAVSNVPPEALDMLRSETD